MGPSMTGQPDLRFLAIALGVLLLLQTSAGHAADRLTIDADAQYRYAQSRLDEEAYEEAIAEFNRFIHFFPADARVPRARFESGMAHYRAGRFEAAAAIFDGLTAVYTGSPVDDDAFIMLSRSHARQGKIEQAMLDLQNLMALSSENATIDRARFELGWLYVDLGRWQAADRAFGRISPENRDRFRTTDLRLALDDSQTIPVKNPTTAGLLSIVPGGGQLYSQRYRDALSAFLLNAGLIWAAWEAFDNDQVALGSVITFVEFGFYAGNIYGAVSSAHKFNRDRNNRFRDDLYRLRPVSLSMAPNRGGAVLCLTVAF